MRSSERMIPAGDDGWHHHPTRARSRSVSGTQDAQHPLPPDSSALPATPSNQRRPSFFASAFGKFVSTSPTYAMSTQPGLSSPSNDSDTTSSSGALTPPPRAAAPVVAIALSDDDEHLDELHDSVNESFAPLTRYWSGKRRSSWGPSNGETGGEATYSASAPTGGGVLAWLSTQQQREGADPSTTDSPVGLFRRLSMGGPKPMAPSSPGSIARETQRVQGFKVPERAVVDTPMTAEEAETRMGRSPQRRGSSARKLSPMSDKMLRGHYEF